MKNRIVLAIAAVVLTCCAACGSDKSEPGKTGGTGGNSGEFLNFCMLPSECQDIAQACMPKDDGSKGTLHDCHLLGHSVGTVEACSARHTECLKVCTEAPPLFDGPPEDLGAGCRDASAAAR